jgi:type I site-specific restriction-modification system R (restriction) subunit
VVEQAVTRLLRAESQNALAENERVHQLLTGGVPVEHRTAAGEVRTALVWLVDWEQPAVNDWLVVHQFTVVEAGRQRRADVVVFLNGLPVGLLELKNPGDAHATLRGAWNQVQTYRYDIPALFTPNALVVISDGTSAAMGSFTAGWEHYAPWKTIDGREVVTARPALEVLIRGVFDQRRFLDLLRSFIVYSDEPAGLVKRVAKYHQYWAVNAAVESTVEAAGPDGDRRGGVVWHTQGSGKSIEMLLYAAKIMRSARMGNPTIRTVRRTNLVQARRFSEQLDDAINRYTNRALTTAEIIAELVKLAKQMRDAAQRHEQLGLSVAEAALYDAIVQNDAAVLQMGDATLKKIAVDLVGAVQQSVMIDWNVKESVRAAMRAKIRRLLAKYDYPPDQEDKAVELILEQAELFATHG